MPRRVIDVSGKKDDVVRLLDSEISKDPLRTPAPYAALSYCWGLDQKAFYKTTKSNFEEHRRGILLSSLPKTLQDAVLVCRRLHIHFLWVDALCIIQGDVDDWRRESAQMHSVYASSHVTIAAHAGASCSDGFLGEQAFGQPHWQRPLKFRLDATGAASV